jgi:hypothetical protein
MTTTSIRTVHLSIAATALALATLTACGGSDPAPAPQPADVAEPDGSAGAAPAGSGTLDPCALVSATDLGAALGADVSAAGTATEQFRGRTCDFTFPLEGSVLDEGRLTMTAWHGSEFFLPGTIGPDLAGIGDAAQDDSDHGIVLFRKGDDVVQVHVLAPGLQKASLDIAEQAANAV